MDCTPITTCLACGSDNLKLTLDLGKQPLANSYKSRKDQEEISYPLAINRCGSCFHVQLTHAVDPRLMFTDYSYVSGTSQTMRDYFAWFANYAHECHEKFVPFYGKTVLDIGCNDGSQLDAFTGKYTTFGVDPAQNLFDTSSAKGHKIYPEFFDMNFVTRHDRVYDLIIAQNVFAHNNDPYNFLQAARNVMHDYTLLFIQTSQANMIQNGEFDTIYHEHISFYNINSMNELCKRTGMYIIDVIKTPLHGTSYLFILSKNPYLHRKFHVSNLIDMEKQIGLLNDQTYIDYAKKVEAIKTKLYNEVTQYSRLDVGWNIVGYGAAAKGMTLLNYTNIPMDFIIDDNPLKQGKYTPGRNIPILSSKALEEHKETCLFVPLAWNFYDEITGKIRSKRTNQYDKYLKYFPEVKVS